MYDKGTGTRKRNCYLATVTNSDCCLNAICYAKQIASWHVHFRFLEHRNLRISLQKGFSFWVTSPPNPLSVLRPWTPLGDLDR